MAWRPRDLRKEAQEEGQEVRGRQDRRPGQGRREGRSASSRASETRPPLIVLAQPRAICAIEEEQPLHRRTHRGTTRSSQGEERQAESRGRCEGGRRRLKEEGRHQGEGHQGEVHQSQGHQGEGRQGEGHQGERHQGEGHQGEGHQREVHQSEEEEAGEEGRREGSPALPVRRNRSQATDHGRPKRLLLRRQRRG